MGRIRNFYQTSTDNSLCKQSVWNSGQLLNKHFWIKCVHCWNFFLFFLFFFFLPYLAHPKIVHETALLWNVLRLSFSGNAGIQGNIWGLQAIPEQKKGWQCHSSNNSGNPKTQLDNTTGFLHPIRRHGEVSPAN